MELVFEIIQAAANVAVIAGIIIALIQLNLSKKAAKADMERRKKEATITFTYEILMELDKLTPILKEYSTVDYNTYMKKENKELHDSILQYLKLMERICVGINADLYDFNIFQRICGHRVWKRWCDFHSLINDIRINRSFNMLYIEYEQVANRLGEIYSSAAPTKGNMENNL